MHRQKKEKIRKVVSLLREYGFSGKILGYLVEALDLEPTVLEERLKNRRSDKEANTRSSMRFLDLKGIYKDNPWLFVNGIAWQLSQSDEDIQADADAALEVEMEEARLRKEGKLWDEWN